MLIRAQLEFSTEPRSSAPRSFLRDLPVWRRAAHVIPRESADLPQLAELNDIIPALGMLIRGGIDDPREIPERRSRSREEIGALTTVKNRCDR